MSVDSATLNYQMNTTTKKRQQRGRAKGTGKRSQGTQRTQRPAFIVTPSSEPTDTERQASAALFQNCINLQGLIRLRLDPRVYDPVRKAYVLLPGESINLQIFSREVAEGLLVGVRESLLDAE